MIQTVGHNTPPQGFKNTRPAIKPPGPFFAAQQQPAKKASKGSFLMGSLLLLTALLSGCSTKYVIPGGPGAAQEKTTMSCGAFEADALCFSRVAFNASKANNGTAARAYAQKSIDAYMEKFNDRTHQSLLTPLAILSIYEMRDEQWDKAKATLNQMQEILGKHYAEEKETIQKNKDQLTLVNRWQKRTEQFKALPRGSENKIYNVEPGFTISGPKDWGEEQVVDYYIHQQLTTLERQNACNAHEQEHICLGIAGLALGKAGLSKVPMLMLERAFKGAMKDEKTSPLTLFMYRFGIAPLYAKTGRPDRAQRSAELGLENLEHYLQVKEALMEQQKTRGEDDAYKKTKARYEQDKLYRILMFRLLAQLADERDELGRALIYLYKMNLAKLDLPL